MVKIVSVDAGSPAAKAGIAAGDELLSINGNSVKDVLDYRFYGTDAHCAVEVRRNGEVLRFSLANREYQDLGMDFCTYLMDEKKRCANKCVFCFIDQNPKGMRETVYFKDDDERLSFLQGNYVTLTNLSDADVERIVKMRISPVNVSVHTMNPALRVRMMGNRFAGEKLRYLRTLCEGGIRINAQLVLCKGWNDGEELDFSLNELCKLETLESIAAVPCGMTAHRDGLAELEPFDAASAADVLDRIDRRAKQNLEQFGSRKVFASDEFYLLAGRELPADEEYEDYPQLENGVGMLRLHETEFKGALRAEEPRRIEKTVSIATGYAAYEHIRALARMAEQTFEGLRVNVFPIRNDFFGHSITVSGLVTGGDLIRQLQGKPLGSRLLLPVNMLRSEGDLFLDGVSKEDVIKTLQVPVRVTERDGWDLLDAILEEEDA